MRKYLVNDLTHLHNWQDILNTYSNNLSKCKMYITLPDNYDFHSNEIPKPVMMGMGDLVAKVANPIGKVLDKTLGTHFKGCGGCAARQDTLNKIIPFNNNR